MNKVSATRESLGGVGSGELLCVRCLPKLAIAKIIYKGHSLCMGCAVEIAGQNKLLKERPNGNDAWDFTLDNPEALRKIKTDAAPAAAESID